MRNPSPHLADKDLQGFSICAVINYSQQLPLSDFILLFDRQRNPRVTEIIGLVLSMPTISAHACNTHNQPGQNFDLWFAENSAHASNEQIFRLANWAVDVRMKYPVREGVSITGLAIAAENKPKELAKRRAEDAQAMLMQFGINAVPYVVESRVYGSDHIFYLSENWKRVEIAILVGGVTRDTITRWVESGILPEPMLMGAFLLWNAAECDGYDVRNREARASCEGT